MFIPVGPCLEVVVFRCAGAGQTAEQSIVVAEVLQQLLFRIDQVRIRERGFRNRIRGAFYDLDVSRPAAQSGSRNHVGRVEAGGRDDLDHATGRHFAGQRRGGQLGLNAFREQAIRRELASAAFRQFLAVIEYVESRPQISTRVAVVDETNGLIRSGGYVVREIGNEVNAGVGYDGRGLSVALPEAMPITNATAKIGNSKLTFASIVPPLGYAGRLGGGQLWRASNSIR